MADIAMCAHMTCPSRKGCKRNAQSGTEAGFWQSWMSYEPDERGRCDSYWPINEKEIDDDGRVRIPIRV